MQQVRGPFLSVFRAAAGTLALATSAVLAAPTSAQTIYKWVDEHGVVNYGNTDVPKARDVSVVDTSPPVAGAGATEAKPRETVARVARISDADMLREELMRSREEIARLKQTAAQTGKGTASRGPDGYAAWREQCELQHRAACNEAAYAESLQGAQVQQPVVAQQPVTYIPKPAAKPGGGPITTMQ